MSEKNKEVKIDYPGLLESFAEASRLSISFVLFPVVLLLIGVWLDKRFDTPPLFILISIGVGFIVFIFQVRKAMEEIKKK